MNELTVIKQLTGPFAKLTDYFLALECTCSIQYVCLSKVRGSISIGALVRTQITIWLVQVNAEV